jgi:hypothetical protein
MTCFAQCLFVDVVYEMLRRGDAPDMFDATRSP